VRHGLDLVQDPLQVASVGGSNLEQVVRLTGDMVAFLDLVDLGEIPVRSVEIVPEPVMKMNARTP